MVFKGDNGSFYDVPWLQHEKLWAIDMVQRLLIIQSHRRQKGEPRKQPRPFMQPLDIIAQFDLPIAELGKMKSYGNATFFDKTAVAAVCYIKEWKPSILLPTRYVVRSKNVYETFGQVLARKVHFITPEEVEFQRKWREDRGAARETELNKRFSFADFAVFVRSKGLEAKDNGNGHWQIIGGKLLVNFYPSRNTLYVAGTHAGKRGASWEDAVMAASEMPPLVEQSRRSRRPIEDYARRIRHKMFREQNGLCYWCKQPMIMGKSPEQTKEGEHLEFASIDHVIPLARNGSNGEDNLVLAHVKCNYDRGCDMPEFNRMNDALDADSGEAKGDE